MQCLNGGLSIVGGNINFFKDLLKKYYDSKGRYSNSYNIFDLRNYINHGSYSNCCTAPEI